MESQTRIARLKNKLLDTGRGRPAPKNLGELDMALAQSWKRSAGHGVDRGMERLPHEAIDFATKDRLNEFLLYEWDQRMDFYNAKHALLADHGAAIFYLDRFGAVFSKGGNQELIRELRGLGVKFGARLTEGFAGTTALSFLTPDAPYVFAAGEMHYAKMFVPYVTVAMNFEFKSSKNMAQLVFVPMGLFSEHFITVLDAAYYMEDYHSKMLSAEAVRIKDTAMEIAQKSAVILIDRHGHVIDCNNALCELFHFHNNDIVGKLLTSFMPQMEGALQLMEDGKSAKLNLLAQGRECSVRCNTVTQSGKVMGMVLMFDQLQQPGKAPAPPQGLMHSFDSMLGEDPSFLRAKTKAMLVAQSPSNVLICGESGTGKELFAQSIHGASPRRHRPFVAVNCAAIPKDLIASELFGYEEGAFTGAKKSGLPGKFEQADGGTLFLDEITEMPIEMQAVLLRVLESGAVTRLGSTRSTEIDVRIISACNRNIEECIGKGSFRSDLYYRLNIIRLDLPSLRERPGDIPLAAAQFLKAISKKLDRDVHAISEDAMQILTACPWPGNMRQLRNAIEAAANVAQNGVIAAADIPEQIVQSCRGDAIRSPGESPSPQPVCAAFTDPIASGMMEIPREGVAMGGILGLMAKHKGNKTKVARELGVARSTLYKMLESGHGEGYGGYEEQRIRELYTLYGGNKTRVAREMGIAKSTLYRKLEKINLE
ncbi:MAG: sigma 54-interacting transcriptional regulator [Clostridiales Family XIII bacterium]|jgi:transcriptional regulator with PAS, ATPase and Fis domain|nr:sigma 54-interacting transcriptional regulator [Clostridiales Family XIII bacterium]